MSSPTSLIFDALHLPRGSTHLRSSNVFPAPSAASSAASFRNIDRTTARAVGNVLAWRKSALGRNLLSSYATLNANQVAVFAMPVKISLQDLTLTYLLLTPC
ncbi:unnamed protein product [Somion occarium]|uniref:Uncharacterized protein n=1 Tax=Somion occarium TaxID=3059160 RepID=A0ABP1CVB9_9APHY